MAIHREFEWRRSYPMLREAASLTGAILLIIAMATGHHRRLAMSIGLFAPPFGVGYYGACAVGTCDPDTAALAILPYLAALLVALIAIATLPWLSIGFL